MKTFLLSPLLALCLSSILPAQTNAPAKPVPPPASTPAAAPAQPSNLPLMRVQPTPTIASSLPDKVKTQIDNFFMLLRQDQVKQAIDDILAESKVKERASEVEALKNKSVTILLEFGRVLDYEVINVKKVGNRLLYITCLGYSENFPLRWTFVYYKPKEQWKLIDIRGDTNVQSLE
ncbi:MAG: hypothetical protein SFY92_06785 [Verrucomicrobiae bacterium]|nr:hypothetical protein [Verrucomicrobiae bacterium]